MSHNKQVPRDPVCGRRMNPNKAWANVRHNGVEYLLCCPRCQSEFEADPERYTRAAAALAGRIRERRQ